jgi:hypothetical protein
MILILNSDQLWGLAQVASEGRIPADLQEICQVAANLEVEIVIPRPAFLEMQRLILVKVAKKRKALEAATALLASYNLSPPTIDAQAIIPDVDPLVLLRKSGATVRIEDPILSDYQDAERRAALRLPPHPGPPESDQEYKTDEMRDLVIWTTSLRLSRSANGATFVSRDSIHTVGFESAEATAASLTGVRSLEIALETLGEETNADRLLRENLIAAWPEVARNLPLPDASKPLRVRARSFAIDDFGFEHATGRIKLENPSGARLEAELEVIFEGKQVNEVRLKSMFLSNQNKRTPREDVRIVLKDSLLGPPAADIAERFEALREQLNS